MYNKILVPLDGSKTAECALEHVLAVAKGCRVLEIYILLVVEPVLPGFYVTDEKAYEMLESWGKEYLTGVQNSLVNEGLNAKTVIVKGKAADSIIDYAQKNGIDLIIMSTHGRSGPSRWAFGSVADRVIRSAVVPVLIAVPKGCRVSS